MAQEQFSAHYLYQQRDAANDRQLYWFQADLVDENKAFRGTTAPYALALPLEKPDQDFTQLVSQFGMVIRHEGHPFFNQLRSTLLIQLAQLMQKNGDVVEDQQGTPGDPAFTPYYCEVMMYKHIEPSEAHEPAMFWFSVVTYTQDGELIEGDHYALSVGSDQKLVLCDRNAQMLHRGRANGQMLDLIHMGCLKAREHPHEILRISRKAQVETVPA